MVHPARVVDASQPTVSSGDSAGPRSRASRAAGERPAITRRRRSPAASVPGVVTQTDPDLRPPAKHAPACPRPIPRQVAAVRTLESFQRFRVPMRIAAKSSADSDRNPFRGEPYACRPCPTWPAVHRLRSALCNPGPRRPSIRGRAGPSGVGHATVWREKEPRTPMDAARAEHGGSRWIRPRAATLPGPRLIPGRRAPVLNGAGRMHRFHRDAGWGAPPLWKRRNLSAPLRCRSAAVVRRRLELLADEDPGIGTDDVPSSPVRPADCRTQSSLERRPPRRCRCIQRRRRGVARRDPHAAFRAGVPAARFAFPAPPVEARNRSGRQ